MIEDPILLLKDQTSFDSLYDINSCSVAVVYAVYDPKKKRIVNKGTSRACGENHNQISIHAERKGINYCRTYDKKNKYEIYIWRYSKEGKIKPVYCCGACCKFANKYNYHDKIFTFNNHKICLATNQPYITLGYQIKHQL
tara:strand:+ start:235 stop:654 length:420 start_codon:yes stop_codon:yes gene_type:complete